MAKYLNLMGEGGIFLTSSQNCRTFLPYQGLIIRGPLALLFASVGGLTPSLAFLYAVSKFISDTLACRHLIWISTSSRY
jgi:hypothetical protein